MILAGWITHNAASLFVVLVVAGASGYFAWRGKQAATATDRAETAEQTGRDFRDYYLAERERTESLEKQLLEQREAKHEALTEIGRLKMATDLTNVLKAIADLRAEIASHFEAFGSALTEFSRTQETQIAALEAIVARLNKEAP
jgi:hypothetical protein